MMFWIGASVFLALIFWIGVFLFLSGRKRGTAAQTTHQQEGAAVRMVMGGVAAGLALLAWLVMTVSLSLHNVGEREVAVVYNFSGTIAGKKDPGVVITFPWQNVKKENVGIQNEEFIFDTNNSAVSKDQQEIFGRIAVNIQVDNVNVVDLYRRVGPSWKTIIVDSRVPQVFKEITSTYTTPEITANRQELKQRTRERLEQELSPYRIKVVDLFVTNLGFSQSYTEAIERKQKQVQDALTAQAKVDQIRAEANQVRTAAQGESDAAVIRARGEATANRLRRQTLTELLVRQNAIDKLNDKVQMIICPPNSVCIPNSPVVPVQGGSGG